MLISAYSVNPGDEIITAKNAGKVQSIELLEDGYVRLEFFGGVQVWIKGSDTVVRRDKFQNFFSPDSVHYSKTVV